MTRNRSKRIGRTAGAVALSAALVLTAAACGDDDDDDAAPVTDAPVEEPADEPADEPAEEPAEETAEEPAEETAEETAEEPAEETAEEPAEETAEEPAEETGELISAERCAANEAAGTITWVSGFDFAAAAGQIEVIAAKAEGYFDDYCLDVELQPGFAPSNSAIVASGTAQVGIAGGMGDVVAPNAEGADLVAVAQYGYAGVEALAVSADSGITSLEQVAGSLMGVKGDIPDSIQAMLAQNGVERSDLEELLLDGFDPVVHFELGIDAVPVYKSNEPNQLDAAGFEYLLFDPLDYGIQTSYAVVFMSRDFVESNPSAAEDFMRASLRGFQFSVENPDAALDAAFELIDAAGNQLFLAREAEAFRWSTESALVLDNAPGNLGELFPDTTGEEFQQLVEVGLLDEVPEYEAMLIPELVAGLYDDSGALIVEAG